MLHVSVKSPSERSITGGRLPIFYPAAEECKNVIPDEKLVQRSLKGDEEAFRLLYERYRRLVYTAVSRIVPDPEEARDATQEIFISVYRSLALWSPLRANFSPWIYRVATNRAIDYWRMHRRRAEQQWPDEQEPQPGGRSLCRRGRPVERILEQRERAAEVRRFLEDLPQPQRRFVILHYCEGLKLREIAEREGYKLGTVKSTLHRATKTIRRKLGRL